MYRIFYHGLNVKHGINIVTLYKLIFFKPNRKRILSQYFTKITKFENNTIFLKIPLILEDFVSTEEIS